MRRPRIASLSSIRHLCAWVQRAPGDRRHARGSHARYVAAPTRVRTSRSTPHRSVAVGRSYPGTVEATEARYPSQWEADVVLVDGATAHLRPIRPEDADALQRFHLGQSPESVYL